MKSSPGHAERDVDVLFDEGDVIAVDKPAGLATLPGTGVGAEQTLLAALREAFAVEPGYPGPGIFGRLDRPTSGLVLAALSGAGHALMEPHWTSGALHKDYLVVVHGKAPARGRIDVPLAARRPRHKGTGRIDAALTTFIRIATDTRVSLLLARIHTGRTHQIRRHMKAVGHPVVGDTRYGHAARDGELSGHDLGLMLHAWRISHDGEVPLLPATLVAPAPQRIVVLTLARGMALPAPDMDLTTGALRAR